MGGSLTVIVLQMQFRVSGFRFPVSGIKEPGHSKPSRPKSLRQDCRHGGSTSPCLYSQLQIRPAPRIALSLVAYGLAAERIQKQRVVVSIVVREVEHLDNG